MNCLAKERSLPDSDHITVALKVAYDGAPFSGFARQPGQSTVQGALESALATLFSREVATTCAGRTDAGVHAVGQVVSFPAPLGELASRPLSTLVRSINALTPDEIVVRSADLHPSEFSARFDARSRTYRYLIATATTPPVFLSRFAWHQPGSLDMAAMRKAVDPLIGEHDFTSFCRAASAKGAPCCRDLQMISFSNAEMLGEELLTITVTASSFLHGMVRALVGTLVQVGRGKRPPEWTAEVLAARDRRAAGENAPAHGLFLWEVRY